MDPDVVLAKLRALMHELENHDEDPSSKVRANAEDAAATFEALDGWLSSGGFKPQAWDRTLAGTGVPPALGTEYSLVEPGFAAVLAREAQAAADGER